MTQTTIYDLPGVKPEQPDGVSLMALGRMLDVAGVPNPGNATPIRSWRDFQEEVEDRVWRTTLYAARRACDRAPPSPPAEPPDVCYAEEHRQELAARPDQTTLQQVATDGGQVDD